MITDSQVAAEISVSPATSDGCDTGRGWSATSCDRIHGDLSAYNILYHDDRPWLIDLPQAVEASRNPNARRLLARDVDNVCKHFERAGLRTQPSAITSSLWRRFARAEL